MQKCLLSLQSMAFNFLRKQLLNGYFLMNFNQLIINFTLTIFISEIGIKI